MWWNSKRQNENPQSCRSGGFLARYGELFRLGCCYLLSTAQPFAYVIANYICQHGDKKCGEKIIQEIHLLSAGGAAAHYYNTKPEQNVQSIKFNSRILQPGIWNLWLLCWDNVFCGDMPCGDCGGTTKERYLEILEFTHFVEFFSFNKIGENHKEKLLVQRVTVVVALDLGTGNTKNPEYESE